MSRKQERARARRRQERRQASIDRRNARRERTTRIVAVLGVLVLVVAVLGIVGATVGFGGDDTPSAAASSSPATLPGCEPPPSPLGTGAELSLPDPAVAEGRTFEATVTTTCGDIVLELDGTRAPQAVASFIELARQNYWVDSPCHRLSTNEGLQVLQCGDPTGTGEGDPGYGFGVENAPADGAYPRGTLAMARTPDPEAGNGGQFFLVYGDSTIPDPDGYTVFGTVKSGLDIVDEIAAQGVAPNSPRAGDGAPLAPISILRVAVTEEKS